MKSGFHQHYGLIGKYYFWCRKTKPHIRLIGVLINSSSGEVLYINNPKYFIETRKAIPIKELKTNCVSLKPLPSN